VHQREAGSGDGILLFAIPAGISAAAAAAAQAVRLNGWMDE